ncbi:MAG: hypothetical protein IKQ56_08590, partial [Lachnospiraceae bacterium]|nr:hypothetical protein [Lachnospiraceae bacterium]
MAIFGQKKRLGDQLIEAGLLSQEQLESALLEQKNTHMKLGETIMAMGLVSDANFAKFMHETQGYELATDDDLKNADPQAIAAVGDDLV